MEIIGICDIHDQTAHLAAIAGMLVTADLVLIAGDLTMKGNERAISDVIDAFPGGVKELLAVHGNMDTRSGIAVLERRGIDLHAKGRMVGPLGIVGVGGSNKTPLFTPTEYNEEDLAAFCEQGFAMLEKNTPVIFVTHTPPRGTLDRVFHVKHVGSQAIREAIEARQPLVCLCGHIHEARGIERIGPTTIVNPGPISSGHFCSISLEIVDNRIRSGHVRILDFSRGGTPRVAQESPVVLRDDSRAR